VDGFHVQGVTDDLERSPASGVGMGQQIAVVASPTDEQALLAFLRESGPIQLCVRGADTAAELWPDEFPPFYHTRTQYFIWNQAFAWTPKVAHQTPDGGGVIEDMATAPVVEFCRTFMDSFRVGRGICLGHGRVYLSDRNKRKGMATWYKRITDWIRWRGVNLSGRGRACYCLPDALRLWQERQSNAPVRGADRRGNRRTAKWPRKSIDGPSP
jgi:hypothetical protein